MKVCSKAHIRTGSFGHCIQRGALQIARPINDYDGRPPRDERRALFMCDRCGEETPHKITYSKRRCLYCHGTTDIIRKRYARGK